MVVGTTRAGASFASADSTARGTLGDPPRVAERTYVTALSWNSDNEFMVHGASQRIKNDI